jgi:crossover junction endodeoxyribonuclease RusA
MKRKTFKPYKPFQIHAPDISPDGELTICLPLPARALSPNARCHPMILHRHKKAAKQRAMIEIRRAAGMFRLPPFTRYTLTFHHATQRNRDDDNAAASCKAYRDGIAEGLCVDDSTLRQTGETRILIDRENPRLEITLIP